MSANRKKGILVLSLGLMIMIFSFLFPIQKSELNKSNQIERNESGEGEKDISLTAVSDRGENTFEYSISERRYTQKEVELLLPEFENQLEELVIGENTSPESVSVDLNYVEEIEGYPFVVSWNSDRSDLIGSQGNIKEEITEETPVVLTAEIEYEEYLYEYSFPVVLVPREYTSDEQWIKDLEEALMLADKSTINNSYITLPGHINGQAVFWKENQNNRGIQIGGFCIVIAILFFFSDSVEEKEKQKKRLQEIRKDYPEFVLKCAMLIGDGMTIRQAFERLARSYQRDVKRKKALYEEVIIGVRELGNGIPERQVYENFGRRCGIRETEKFGHIMSRNLRKGSEGLKNALREEAGEAMEMHKETVKKQGETAGTKLLFPMLILLLIVMVIIMVPAFSTFNI